MTDVCRFLALSLCLLLAGTRLMAEETDSLADDTLAKEVHASVIVADPGNVLYSRVGHCAIHMRAPEYNLDYVFSYEAEDVRQKVLAFLAGRLRMGMFAIPIDDYLSNYEKEGRGVREYELNLPLAVKRNLWRVLDEHVMRGTDLSYDYITRGCAHSTLMMLKEGLDSTAIEYGPWPEKFQTMTRQELTGLQLTEQPWAWAFLNVICLVQDDGITTENKVIMPKDLIAVLKDARVNGQPLMSSEPKVLLPSIAKTERPWFTPLHLSVILLMLAFMTFIPARKCRAWIRGYTALILAIQFLIGTLVTYLVFFSDLCCTEWNWLVIPLNPLPLIFWKWRKHWLLPYAAVIVLWALAMAVSPHQITDTPFVVLSIAIATTYVRCRQSCKETNSIR